MAHPAAPQTTDPRDLDRAATTWGGFTKLMTVGVIGVVATLALMALFLL